MATDASYADYVCDQLRTAGGITIRKMFGEYGLYRHGKIVALIADNQLFVKPTPAGEAVLGMPTYGPPYPGAKPFFNVSDLLDEPATLVQLIIATDAALPAPKAKAAKKAAGKKAATKKAAPRQVVTKKAPAKKKPSAKKKASAKAKPARTAIRRK